MDLYCWCLGCCWKKVRIQIRNKGNFYWSLKDEASYAKMVIKLQENWGSILKTHDGHLSDKRVGKCVSGEWTSSFFGLQSFARLQTKVRSFHTTIKHLKRSEVVFYLSAIQNLDPPKDWKCGRGTISKLWRCSGPSKSGGGHQRSKEVTLSNVLWQCGGFGTKFKGLLPKRMWVFVFFITQLLGGECWDHQNQRQTL